MKETEEEFVMKCKVLLLRGREKQAIPNLIFSIRRIFLLIAFWIAGFLIVLQWNSDDSYLSTALPEAVDLKLDQSSKDILRSVHCFQRANNRDRSPLFSFRWKEAPPAPGGR